MKTCTYLIMVVVMFSMIISCTKQNDIYFNSKELTGNWKWVRTDGGIAFNIHDTPASTGKDITLTLTRDQKYFIYTNDTLTSQGTFVIKTEKSIVDSKDRGVIDFSVNQDMMIQNLDNNNLELSDNFYDGVGSLYNRK